MKVVYLNTNGFAGVSNKKNSLNDRVLNAEKIISKIFESSSPDVLFLSEFDANSEEGKRIFKLLYDKDYYRVYPNNWTFIKENYTSIVIAFTKERKKSMQSPSNWLKWNEICLADYHIIGVHIPSSEHEKKSAKEFWGNLCDYFIKHIDEKVLYIGDMNVFDDRTDGKINFNNLLENNGARDAWIEMGHTNNTEEDFTYYRKTRLDYAILSEKMPNITKMENHREFISDGLSDHSALIIEF